MPSSPAYHRMYSWRYREERRVAGLCVRCGERREPGRVSTCKECGRIRKIKRGVNPSTAPQESAFSL